MYVRKTDDGFYIYHISKNKKIYSGTKCVDMDDIYIYIDIDIEKKTCVYMSIFILQIKLIDVDLFHPWKLYISTKWDWSKG